MVMAGVVAIGGIILNTDYSSKFSYVYQLHRDAPVEMLCVNTERLI